MLFFLFLLLGQVHVMKDKGELYPQEKLQVVIEGECSPSQTANMDAFLKTLKEQMKFGSFALSSSTIVNNSMGHFELKIELLPLREGSLIFAPGMLSFSDGSTQEVPSFTIQMKRRYLPLEFVPPLPLRPEEAITMDRSNKKLSIKNPEEELQKIRARSLAWNTLFLLVIALFLGIAFFWAIRWYKRLPPKEKPKPKRDFSLELQKVQESRALMSLIKEMLSHQEKTVAEIVLMYPEKKSLKGLLERLEAAEFSGKPLSNEDLQAAILETKTLFKV